MHNTLCQKYFQYARRTKKQILQFNVYDDSQSLVYKDKDYVVKVKYFLDKVKLEQYVFYINMMNAIFEKAFDQHIVSSLSNCIVTISPYCQKVSIPPTFYKEFMIQQMKKYSCYLYDISSAERRLYSIPNDELVFKCKNYNNILISEVDDSNITMHNKWLFIYDATIDKIIDN